MSGESVVVRGGVYVDVALCFLCFLLWCLEWCLGLAELARPAPELGTAWNDFGLAMPEDVGDLVARGRRVDFLLGRPLAARCCARTFAEGLNVELAGGGGLC